MQRQEKSGAAWRLVVGTSLSKAAQARASAGPPPPIVVSTAWNVQHPAQQTYGVAVRIPSNKPTPHFISFAKY